MFANNHFVILRNDKILTLMTIKFNGHGIIAVFEGEKIRRELNKNCKATLI